MPSKITYLAVDPGETSGWATFDENGEVISLGQVKGFDEFGDFLDTFDTQPPKVVIVEAYRVREQNKNFGSKVPTIQVIGMLRRKTKKVWNAEFVEQESHIKTVGYMWAGLKPESNHAKSHKFDAFVHGVWYLQKNGIRQSRLARHDE